MQNRVLKKFGTILINEIEKMVFNKVKTANIKLYVILISQYRTQIKLCTKYTKFCVSQIFFK